MSELKRLSWSLVVLLASAGLIACGSEGTEGDDDDMQEDVILEPPPAGEGIQYTMKTALDAGIEAEHCMFVKAPAEGLLINREEVKYTEGSHHFLLFETTYDEIPTTTNDGTPVDTTGVFDCSDGPGADWSVTRVLGGSQNANPQPGPMFPPDVAIRVQPNQVLMMNAHYINASGEALEPEVFINLWTLSEAEMRVEGDVLFLYNPLIKVAQNTTGRARMRCPVHEDISIHTLQSHMHARGVGYEAMVMGEQAFYTNDKWEDVPVGRFVDGLVVEQGEYFDYYCDYNNRESRDIEQGPRSTDEMCMMVGTFWPANQNIANCLSETGEGFAGEWVGVGTVSCADTLDCARGAMTGGLGEIADCMYAADPSVASEASAAVLCLAQAGDPSVNCNDAIGACESM
jgi:hypothetical protein